MKPAVVGHVEYVEFAHVEVPGQHRDLPVRELQLLLRADARGG